MTSASLMREAGHSKPVHWDTLGDGVGTEVGGGSRWGHTCAPVADSCQGMAKTTIL